MGGFTKKQRSSCMPCPIVKCVMWQVANLHRAYRDRDTSIATRGCVGVLLEGVLVVWDG